MARFPSPIAAPGPWRASDVKSGDAREISDGHLIECLPTKKRGGGAQALGGMVVSTDPAVRAAGVEVGVSPHPNMLRAPDVAVLDEDLDSEWAHRAPPLAIEYADRGQDEADLAKKIEELLAAGTRFVWVVRLVGPRRVEVHRPGVAREVVHPGEALEALGVLANPVPVEALYDPDAARRATLRNILQREGYASLQAVWAEGRSEGTREGRAEGRVEGRAEGRVEGRAEGRVEGLAEGRLAGLRDAVLAVLAGRGFTLDATQRARLESERDEATLRRCLAAGLTAASTAEVLG